LYGANEGVVVVMMADSGDTKDEMLEKERYRRKELKWRD
jgi:hypothetical protein